MPLIIPLAHDPCSSLWPLTGAAGRANHLLFFISSFPLHIVCFSCSILILHDIIFHLLKKYATNVTNVSLTDYLLGITAYSQVYCRRCWGKSCHNRICQNCLHLRWITRESTFLAQYISCWEMNKKEMQSVPSHASEQRKMLLNFPYQVHSYLLACLSWRAGRQVET